MIAGRLAATQPRHYAASPLEREMTKSTTKRELIDTGRSKGFAKRTAKGQFKEIDDVGRSLRGIDGEERRRL